MKKSILTLTISAFLGFSTAVLGADVAPRFEPSALSFSGGRDFTNGRLLITGPDDFEAEESSSKGLPVFRVQGGRMRDGYYQFSVSAATAEKVKIKKPVDNGRGAAAKDYTLKPFSLSGMFQIKRGAILEIDEAAMREEDLSEEAK